MVRGITCYDNTDAEVDARGRFRQRDGNVMPRVLFGEELQRAAVDVRVR